MNFDDAKAPFFLSYCNADNDYPNGWVTEFHDRLTKALSNHLGRTRWPENKEPIYQEFTKWTAGDLDETLAQAARSSFVLVIVAGKNYHESPYCLKEIQWFLGENPEVRRQRIFIVAKDKNVKDKLIEKTKNDKDLSSLLSGLIWIPFYNKNSPDGLSTDKDKDKYNEWLGAIAKKYQTWSEPPHEHVQIAPKLTSLDSGFDSVLSQPNPSNIATTPSCAPRIFIGPPTKDIESAVASWCKELTEKLNGHAEVASIIESELGFPTQLKAKLKDASSLVLPVGFKELINPAIEGGHIRMLCDQWVKVHSSLSNVHFVKFGDLPDPWPDDLVDSAEFLREIWEKSYPPDKPPACLTPPRERSPDSPFHSLVVVDQQGPFGASIESWLTQREQRVTVEPIDLRAIAGVKFKPNVSEGYRTDTKERATDAFKKAVFLLALRSDQDEPYDTCNSVLLSIWQQLTEIRGPSWPDYIKFFAAVIRPPIGDDELTIGKVKAFQFTSHSDGRLEPANPETEKILLDELRKMLEPKSAQRDAP